MNFKLCSLPSGMIKLCTAPTPSHPEHHIHIYNLLIIHVGNTMVIRLASSCQNNCDKITLILLNSGTDMQK